MLGGRYQRGRQLGTQRLGTVFAGRDTQLDVPVLLIYLGQSADDAVLQGLIERDRTGRWKDLPGGAPLLGYTRDPTGNRPVLVREHVKGQPLSVTFAQGPISKGQGLWLGERLLSALQPLHEQKRVHGGLHPDAVYVEPVKWNLRIVQPLPDRVDVNTPPDPESLAWLAPEVVEDHTQARPESDVYAVGALIYRALAGRTHLTGKTTLARFQAIREGRFTSLHEAASHLPPDLCAAIDSALRAQPERRPRSAFEFRHTLALLREDPPV